MKKYLSISMLLLLMLSNPKIYGNSNSSNEVEEIIINSKMVMKIGSDRKNEDFFKPFSFAIDKEENIYILDSGNCRVQCFNRDGQFKYSFGKKGQGPGEFSEGTQKIKILEDDNIYILDIRTFKIIVYDKKGKYLFQIKTRELYDDILLINGTYYVSHILLKENHSPIHKINLSGEIEKTFGEIIEPSIGITKQVNKLKYPQGIDVYFRRWTSLERKKDGNIIFYQRLPQCIIEYNSNGEMIRRISIEMDYDTKNRYYPFESDDGESRGMKVNKPVPSLNYLKVNEDESIDAVFMNPDNSFTYIDKYDSNYKLLRRYKAAIKIINPEKMDYIKQIYFDNQNNLYYLVEYEDDCPQIIKVKIEIDKPI